MKTSSEQFEEWVRNRANDLDYKHMEYLLKTFDNGVYAVTWVDMAWEGWQASRQCIEVEPPELLTTPVKQFEFERDCQWREAISKSGIKVKGA